MHINTYTHLRASTRRIRRRDPACPTPSRPRRRPASGAGHRQPTAAFARYVRTESSTYYFGHFMIT